MKTSSLAHCKNINVQTFTDQQTEQALLIQSFFNFPISPLPAHFIACIAVGITLTIWFEIALFFTLNDY